MQGALTGRNTIYGESWFGAELPSKLGALTLPVALFGHSEDELGGGIPALP